MRTSRRLSSRRDTRQPRHYVLKIGALLGAVLCLAALLNGLWLTASALLVVTALAGAAAARNAQRKRSGRHMVAWPVSTRFAGTFFKIALPAALASYWWITKRHLLWAAAPGVAFGLYAMAAQAGRSGY